jgi:hypothetical protein
MLDEGLNEFWDMRMMRERNQGTHGTTPLLKRLGFEIDAPALTGIACWRCCRARRTAAAQIHGTA